MAEEIIFGSKIPHPESWQNFDSCDRSVGKRSLLALECRILSKQDLQLEVDRLHYILRQKILNKYPKKCEDSYLHSKMR